MSTLLHELLATSARRHPERTALADRGRTHSYLDLDLWSSRLAQALVAHDVRPGDRVGILLDKSVEAVVAIYGILKAGACYVPCDPQAPPARTSLIVRDCDMRLLCTSAAKQDSWPQLGDPDVALSKLVLLDEVKPAEPMPPRVTVVDCARAVLSDHDGSAPEVSITDRDLAYILYTSGSTGQPKGVMLTHRNAMAFVEWAVRAAGLNESDRLSSHAPFHFDLSVFDLFAAAASGASTWLVPAAASLFPVQLARFIRDTGITVWYSVPSVLSLLAQRGGLREDGLPRLRLVLFAGEVFPTRFLRALMLQLPHARFGNLYGPTETNVCMAYWLSGLPEDDRDIPIGRAVAGAEVFLAYDESSDDPDVGELCVRGPTVARGYWGSPQPTARRFVADAADGDGTVYRTGDLARRLPDGTYLFLGRRDNQIKSRGHRIELDEIEATLRRHPGVVEVVVTAVPHELGTSRIRAHLVVDGGTTRSDLRRHCQRLLPRHMVPDELDVRDDLPRTSTGKADRRALTDQQIASECK
ncbi:MULTISPECIES: amino acid adenylation domain-containing protein [unclassified Micromonospora]|uniref:amino acid adenylation domain-containing protein n=1 Tax=unclassified Micromonospora TaxID=2617518 RepID=UPI0010759B86